MTTRYQKVSRLPWPKARFKAHAHDAYPQSFKSSGKHSWENRKAHVDFGDPSYIKSHLLCSVVNSRIFYTTAIWSENRLKIAKNRHVVYNT